MAKRNATPRRPRKHGLGSNDVIAFAPTTDREKARTFFGETLGLNLMSEDPFALVFDANGTALRVVDVSAVNSYRPADFTILGWAVADIAEVVKSLTAKGVQFERYPGMPQDALGIWTSPSRAKIAWFRDPDGNVLSLTEY